MATAAKPHWRFDIPANAVGLGCLGKPLGSKRPHDRVYIATYELKFIIAMLRRFEFQAKNPTPKQHRVSGKQPQSA
jgi:hypothetical protein